MMVSGLGGARWRWRYSAVGERARARRGRESEHHRVSEHDVVPSSACFSLTCWTGAGLRTPSGGYGLWPVGHYGGCPGWFKRVMELTNRATLNP